MSTASFATIFQHVPQEQQEQFLSFRATHPVKHLTIHGQSWDYLSGGQGEETLVLLTGGLNSSEVWFQVMLAFEDSYRVIVLRYPSVAKVAELVEGVASILDAEQTNHITMLGESLGGMVAQCFVRRYPERVERLILASTVAPDKNYLPRASRQKRLVSLFPPALLRSISVRRVLNILAATPENERALWSAIIREQVALYITKQWLISQFNLIADYCAHYAFTPEDLKDWPGSILILKADDDEIIQRLPHDQLSTLYTRARVHIFHNAGHVPLITKREEYIETVRSFLSEAPRI